MQTQITAQTIRDGFNAMIEKAQEANDWKAVIAFELAREYYTNAEFKKTLEDDCFRRTYKVAR